jgi:hypothetical protein
MDGEWVSWSHAWLVPFLLLSRRRYWLTETGEACLESLTRSIERYYKEIELFSILYEEQPVHEVRRLRAASAPASRRESRSTAPGATRQSLVPKRSRA